VNGTLLVRVDVEHVEAARRADVRLATVDACAREVAACG
jgi:hypothetical protein